MNQEIEQNPESAFIFAPLIKTAEPIKFNEDESEKLFYHYLKLRPDFTEITLLDKIHLSIELTKETFNQHCMRMINVYTPSETDQISSKL